MTSIYRKIPGYCRRGLHEMTPENTVIHPTKGWKMCRACRSATRQRDTERHRPRRAAYSKTWRAKNAAKLRAERRRREREAREFLNSYKANTPCADCKRTYPPVCMDFDHVRGTKRFNIGSATAKSIARLQQEIEKCELVCANCHRLRTAARSESLSE